MSTLEVTQLLTATLWALLARHQARPLEDPQPVSAAISATFAVLFMIFFVAGVPT